MDHNPQGQGGRRHFHRGRRGPDRRGPDRRGPQPAAQEQTGRGEVDVEQIMRDIRARISQRHGIELTNQQIQELAARRLESILDPRTVKPALLDQLRRAAGTQPDAPAPRPEPPYTFEDTTLYESHRGLMRFIRRLLNPILKLFFNPNPLIRALNIQSRTNAEMLAREAERDRRQAEWNALHYEILHRVVTEISRVTLEVQNVSMRTESLAGKVDFNERRVRGIEGAMHQARPPGRREEGRREEGRREDGRREEGRRDVQEVPPAQVVVPTAETVSNEPAAAAQGQPSEGARRRRRRRRGRRGAGAPGEVIPGAADATVLEADEPEEGADEDEAAPLVAEPDLTAEGADLPAEGVALPRERVDLPAGAGSHRDLPAEAGSHRELLAEAGNHRMTGEPSADLPAEAGRDRSVEETIAVVAEAESREEPLTVEATAHAEPMQQDVSSAPEPETPREDLATPAPPERRDLEPTDR